MIAGVNEGTMAEWMNKGNYDRVSERSPGHSGVCPPGLAGPPGVMSRGVT